MKNTLDKRCSRTDIDKPVITNLKRERQFSTYRDHIIRVLLSQKLSQGKILDLSDIMQIQNSDPNICS